MVVADTRAANRAATGAAVRSPRIVREFQQHPLIIEPNANISTSVDAECYDVMYVTRDWVSARVPRTARRIQH